MDIYQQSLAAHRKKQGKLGIESLMSVKNREELSIAYTPGVAEPCRVIASNEGESFNLTMRGRTVAVISNGTAVLGLGNIGAAAGLPVMEGKAVLMKEFAGVDAIPLVINESDPKKIIQFVRQVAPTFAGINLEDIAAPDCFLIEDDLQDLGIPVFHDDQHGTAIVVTAALRNAAVVVNKKWTDLNVVVVGAGAAGLAISQMLLGLAREGGEYKPVDGLESVKSVTVVDSKGGICDKRADINDYKDAITKVPGGSVQCGSLTEVIAGKDVVIGVSQPNVIAPEMINTMAKEPIVMAMSNPTPEIMPEDALEAGAAVVATGRSDFPNQVNNVLAFPGVFRAVIDGRLTKITAVQKAAAAKALAEMVSSPTKDKILPDPFEPGIANVVAQAMLAVK